MIIEKREREREREREITDETYVTMSWIFEESKATASAKVKESRAINTIEENSQPSYLSYNFLRKMKLGVIFTKWIQWITNLNN